MISRKEKVLRNFLGFSSLWVFFLIIFRHYPLIIDYLTALPGYLIMVYGCYFLITVGDSVQKIKEDPKELELLKKDILVAQEYMKLNFGNFEKSN
jgi:hypothetical protein